MSSLRIASFLPAATEMVAALGLEDALVARSFECDWPHSVRQLPVVVDAALSFEGMSPGLIDTVVTARAENNESGYVVNTELLKNLKPTHIIAQDLCEVCAPSGGSVEEALAALESPPAVITLSPRSLTDIAQNMRDLGDIFDRHNEAEALLIEWKARIDDVQARVNNMHRIRCFVMEWVDPIYCSGHWVAEMVQMAGGYDLLARPGQDSIRVDWSEVLASNPDVLILAPCGYNVEDASQQLSLLQKLPGWDTLPAVKSKKVYAVNAGAYVTRPGPRVVDGIEMLAYLLHQ